MSKIPIANIGDVNIEYVERHFPEAAKEIVRLENLMATGKESEGDFLSLAKLLNSVGQKAKAEQLLRTNVVDEGDPIHCAYIELYGHQASNELETAIVAFSKQFGVLLSELGTPRFVRRTYLSRPEPKQEIVDPRIEIFLRVPCEVEFTYPIEGVIADISCELPELFSKYLLLQRVNGFWVYLQGNM